MPGFLASHTIPFSQPNSAKNGSVPLDLLSILQTNLAGRYAVDREIGRGGMATVFGARDLINDRPVAIKLLHPDLAMAVGGKRFLREIEILSQLTHPNILPLLDSGTIELVSGLDLPWYAMPLVEGDTLRGRLKREGQLPLTSALSYTRDVCAALGHAHREGFVHRDIKPENILLSNGKALLADFGIARAVTVAAGDNLSSTGIVVGTPAYMSPEQSVGSPILDGRSDIYSVGIVLYEMISGEPPFTGITPQAISARHQFETPPSLRIVRPDLSEGIQAAVEQALAKVAADRFQTVEELVESLDRPKRPSTRTVPGSLWLSLTLGLVLVAVTLWQVLRNAAPPVLLDSSRYVVLPFQHRGPNPSPLSGLDCQFLVSDILARIPDHGIVSDLTVASELEAEDRTITRESALALATRLGAGRLIWGQVASAGDTVKVTGILYNVSNGLELESIPLRIPTADIQIGDLASRFASLTYALVLPGSPTPETSADVLGARSFPAWQRYATGDSALNTWKLRYAQSQYRAALTLDPEFPNANLKLAQVSQWLGDPASEWRAPAVKAVGTGQRLAPSSLVMAQSLLAMANRDYPAACSQYRHLLRRDSLDYRGWFGLGECLSSDDRVVADSSSPSGWRFRTSYEAAIRAYKRALTLVPATHLVYGGASLQSLSAKLLTEVDTRRHGRSDTTNNSRFFVASPMLDADTLAFIPQPAEASVSQVRLGASWRAALERNRTILLSITSEWISRFPRSNVARIAQSEALERAQQLGIPDSSTSALGVLKGLRRGYRGSDLSLITREVRLLTKMRHLSAARALAESALAYPPATPSESQEQAGLAALIGRFSRAADLLQQYPETLFFNSKGQLVRLPAPVAAEAARLLAYAGPAENSESLQVISLRLKLAIQQSIIPAKQQEALDASQLLPQLLSFPALGRPSENGYQLATIENRIMDGHTDEARRLLLALSQQQFVELDPFRPIDFGLLKARLWAAVGDTNEARRRLESYLNLPTALSTEVLEQVTQASAWTHLLQYCRMLRCTSDTATLDTSIAALTRP